MIYYKEMKVFIYNKYIYWSICKIILSYTFKIFIIYNLFLFYVHWYFACMYVWVRVPETLEP